jgi:hypothetical protein
MRKLGVFLVSLLLLAGCGKLFRQSERIIVAECYDKKLYADELGGLVPSSAGKLDSLTQVNAFIDSWVRRQVLVHQAEMNLPPSELDFTKRLEDYRTSLVIYAYETQLIEQYLDTVVSQEEISTYYEEHKENFQLRSTMVRVAYVILDADCKQEKDFKKLLSDRDTLDVARLDDLASQHAKFASLDVDTWMRLDDFLTIVPIEIFNHESFLRKNRFVSFEKDGFIYMVRFEDYLLEQSVSPLELEEARIKNIILLKRQKELLERMHSELYEQAKNEKVFEIY